MSFTEKPTFALVHGSWHDSWSMGPLCSALQARDYPAVAMDIPIEDPTNTFDDFGLAVARSLQGIDNLIGVFHSRAGNYGPRAVNILNSSGSRPVVQKMIFLASSFEAPTLQALGVSEAEASAAPLKNTPESRNAVIPRPDLGTDMTEFDPTGALRYLYHDVEPEIALEAVKHLRPQRRSEDEPPMDTWPDVPQEYIICEEDRMVRPEWSMYAARTWLGVEPHRMPGSHSPALSRPDQLAALLIDLARE